MKYMLSVLFLLLIGSVGYAREYSYQASQPPKSPVIQSVGTGTSVSISTSAWTAVPTTSTLANRAYVKVSNPASNANAVMCIAKKASPAEAITVNPVEIVPGANPAIPAPADFTVYCIAKTAAQTVSVVEFGE